MAEAGFFSFDNIFKVDFGLLFNPIHNWWGKSHQFLLLWFRSFLKTIPPEMSWFLSRSIRIFLNNVKSTSASSRSVDEQRYTHWRRCLTLLTVVQCMRMMDASATVSFALSACAHAFRLDELWQKNRFVGVAMIILLLIHKKYESKHLHTITTDFQTFDSIVRK